LEVCIGTGRPFSSFKTSSNVERNFKVITIGLNADREIIYNRINDRVDVMMDNGLLKEVTSLTNKQNLNALKTVGYKELFKHLNKKCSLDYAVSEIKKNSRRFAKRQLTWFKKDPNILWFDYNDKLEDIIKAIEQEILAKSN